MSASSFEHALCRCSRALFEAHKHTTERPCHRTSVLAAAVNHQRASFSTSKARQKQSGGVPAFSITSSPELDEIFRQVRTKIFLPAYLRPQQRQLIYKNKYKSMLENDPIVLDLGSDSFTLQHIDVLKDVPSSWKSIKRALEIMGPKPAEQWRNVIPLLQGMKAAKIKLKTAQIERIVRDTAGAQMADVVLHAAEQVSTTGLSLGNLRIAREVMWAFRTLAFKNSWKSEHLRKAYTMAQRAAALMEEKGHESAQGLGPDPRSEPDVIGVLLELSARKASESRDKEDMNAVKLYVERMIPNLERVLSQSPLTEQELIWVPDASYELVRWTPVCEGLEIAKELLQDALPHVSHVEELLQKVKNDRMVPAENAILASREVGLNGNWRGRDWYTDATGKRENSSLYQNFAQGR